MVNKTRTIDIELAIMNEFNFRQNLIVPNISSMMGVLPFETDMLVITKSGMAYGFEIKTSKSDLKKDFKKPQHTKINEFKNGKTGMERYYGKFKYFYYAVPYELVDLALELIPDFCGLWCFTKSDEHFIHSSFRIRALRRQGFKVRMVKFIT